MEIGAYIILLALVLGCIISAGADADTDRYNEDKKSLYNAVKFKNETEVTRIITAQKNETAKKKLLDSINNEGETLFSIAIKNEDKDMVELLVEHGADLLKNHTLLGEERTPLEFAQQYKMEQGCFGECPAKMDDIISYLTEEQEEGSSGIMAPPGWVPFAVGGFAILVVICMVVLAMACHMRKDKTANGYENTNDDNSASIGDPTVVTTV